MFKNKKLLITGGTGSFGGAVLKNFINTNIKEIRIFSRDEKKQEDMRISLANPKLKFYIGDVRNFQSISEAMRGVDYVFHAAALKQVPSCEFYPMEAVQTNIIGAENMLNAAIANKVEKVILLSTDKAVYPINAMGLSKAMMEKIAISKARLELNTETTICLTRYGNVMASRGSVIPLFINQILKNSEITITDPMMTRFLMSLEESVGLVMYAFKHGKSGDIFVQKSPAATIQDIAIALKKIFNSNAPIKIIGTRHGEKLYESLISREEMVRSLDHEKYYQIKIDDRDLNYAKYYVEGAKAINLSDDYTSHNTHRLNVDEIIDIFNNLECVRENLHA